MTGSRPSFGRLFLLLFTILIAAPLLEPVSDHIRERSDAFNDLRFDLGQSVGQHPGTVRPELVIPISGGAGQILLAPAEAEVDIVQTRRIVSDSGFEIPYHQSDVSIRMRFEPVDWAAFLSAGETLNWREARVRVRVGIPKMLQGDVRMRADGREHRFRKTQTGQHRFEYTAPAPRDLGAWSTVSYSLTGWGNFSVAPMGWRTRVKLTSELGLDKFQGIQPVSFEQSAFDFSAIYDMDRDQFYERAVRGTEFRRKPEPGEAAFLGMRFGEMEDAPYAEIHTRGADMPYRHVGSAVAYAPQVLALSILLLFLIDWIRGRDSGDTAYAAVTLAGVGGLLVMVFAAEALGGRNAFILGLFVIGLIAGGALRRGFPLGWPVMAALMALPWLPLLFLHVWMGPWHPALPDVLLALTVAGCAVIAGLEWGVRRLRRSRAA